MGSAPRATPSPGRWTAGSPTPTLPRRDRQGSPRPARTAAPSASGGSSGPAALIAGAPGHRSPRLAGSLEGLGERAQPSGREANELERSREKTLERETGFEPATSTLARLRSTE